MVEETSDYEQCRKTFREAIKITSTVYERKRRLAFDPNYQARNEKEEAEYRECEATMRRAEKLNQEREFPDFYSMATLAALQHNKSLKEVLNDEDIVQTFVQQMNIAAKCLGRRKRSAYLFNDEDEDEDDRVKDYAPMYKIEPPDEENEDFPVSQDN